MAFRYMVFNVLACNRDDHAKQFSFLMDRAGGWKLAPAYDLTFSEGPGGEHSTSIGGEGRNPSRRDVLRLAEVVGVREPDAVIEEVMAAVASWQGFASDIDVGAESAARIGARIEAIRRGF